MPHCPSAGSAAEAVQLAEQVLEDALVAGVDTAPARAALEVARKAAAAERDAANQAAREVADSKYAVAIRAEAESVAQTQAQVIGAIATIESASGAEPLPEPTESPIVASAASPNAMPCAPACNPRRPNSPRSALAARVATSSPAMLRPWPR
jgi:hypothetical protein